MSSQPLIFLDLDDVLCLNAPYGGYDVFVQPHPDDLWEKLFSQEAVAILLEVVRQHRPRVVLTTSWLRLLEKSGFEGLFRQTGLHVIADSLHEQWDAPQATGMSRLQAIENWLQRNHNHERFVVLDDNLSGTDLADSRIDRAGRLVLCEVGIGLQAAHLGTIHRALHS